MSREKPQIEALESRLRALYAGLDARAGFESRVMGRIAVMKPATREELVARYERRRETVRRRLRRDAWTNALTLAGLAAGAAALAWRYASEIAHALAGDPLLIGAVTLAALVIPVWPVPGRTMRAAG